MNRRNFIKRVGLLGAGIALSESAAFAELGNSYSKKKALLLHFRP